MRPMCLVASSPIFFQVFPPSSDLYAPSPQEELCRLLGSPVPTQTIDGSDGAIAISPIVDTPSLSKIGSQVVPLLVVFHTPPGAVPSKSSQTRRETSRKPESSKEHSTQASFPSPCLEGPACYSGWAVWRIKCFKRANQPGAKKDARWPRSVSRPGILP